MIGRQEYEFEWYTRWYTCGERRFVSYFIFHLHHIHIPHVSALALTNGNRELAKCAENDDHVMRVKKLSGFQKGDLCFSHYGHYPNYVTLGDKIRLRERS